MWLTPTGKKASSQHGRGSVQWRKGSSAACCRGGVGPLGVHVSARRCRIRTTKTQAGDCHTVRRRRRRPKANVTLRVAGSMRRPDLGKHCTALIECRFGFRAACTVANAARRGDGGVHWSPDAPLHPATNTTSHPQHHCHQTLLQHCSIPPMLSPVPVPLAGHS